MEGVWKDTDAEKIEIVGREVGWGGWVVVGGGVGGEGGQGGWGKWGGGGSCVL